MPVANLKPFNILEAMKPEKEGSESLDTFVRQAVAKEPAVPFPRPAADSPVQWIQLLQALDYQDLPGWPLLAPPKLEMHKCDKCTREFCSLINYRRHIRVHRRALKLDKDFPKNREFLGIFWDKLSLEDAMDIVSLGNISLEEIPGSSIVKGLISLIRKPGFYSLPQAYVRAGSALLDVVQARPSKFPIASQELFDILDDASEKTFLCAGTALSVQKFVVDGEAAKIVLELKNIVACTCFLLEQKLVNAWLADKDAESLRCQKLLMEEEEAAQKRQAELLEKRRLKKLRQKEQQRMKEQIESEEAVSEENFSDSLYVAPSAEISSLPSAEICSPFATSVVPSYALEASLDPKTRIDMDTNCSELSDDCMPSNDFNFRDFDHRTEKGNAYWHQTVSGRPLASSHHGASSGIHSGVAFPKLAPAVKQGVHRGQKNISLTNGHKIWTRKGKPDTRGGDKVVVLGESSDQISQVLLDSRRDPEDQLDQDENHEVLIGSIPVTLRESNDHCQCVILASPVSLADHRAGDNQLPQNKITQERHAKFDSGHTGTNRSVKLWRPVGKHESTSITTIKDGKRAMTKEICLPHFDSHENSRKPDSSTPQGEGEDPGGLKLFCSKSAEAFLTQRWKEAIAAEHVRLVLTPESKSANHDNDLDVLNPNIRCENRLSNVGTPEPVANEAPKMKSKIKAGKNRRLKYIPREKAALNQVLIG